MIKKTIKTIFTLALSLALLLGVFPAAFAAESNGEITISGTTPGKVYDVYRIFDLVMTKDSDDNDLFDYTINSDFAGFFEDMTDAQAVGLIAATESDSDELNALAEQIKTYALANNIDPIASIAADSDTTVIDGLELGYYLVYPQGGITAACSLTTTKPQAEVEVKTEYPTAVKKIVESGQKLDHSSAQIGDSISFEIVSDIPDVTGYSSYTYVITDTLSKGLSYNDDLVVKLGNDVISDGYTLAPPSTDPVTGKTTIEITFTDFIDDFADKTGQKITVSYSATLTTDAVIGQGGNPNEVELEYSNDPDDVNSKDTTPSDIVTVFTFNLDALKVDGADNSPLEGAVFSLWTTSANSGASMQYPEDADPQDQITLYPVATKTSGEDGDLLFNVKAGTYYLFEDEAPTGYNKMKDPIIFSVTPSVDEDNLILSGITSDNTSLSSTGGTGVITTTIENRSGLELPETGGIGTIIFIVLGSALLIAAVAVFVSFMKKQRKNTRYFNN
ncbi:SpaH/EbpB family LPXTG-anchored major pilin [Clostridiaceae bacterium OttesenSCG-928-D20]|nr:SpaH/EbpB family LPXTG-anchored major pilin [Clostridiaceae bacterium OttesenSCG-928-D20]